MARASEYSSKIAVYSICIGYALGTLSLTFCGYIHRTSSIVTLAEAIIFRMAAATSMAAAVAASSGQSAQFMAIAAIAKAGDNIVSTYVLQMATHSH